MSDKIVFPLQPLLDSNLTLCQTISKLNRIVYFRLKRTNKKIANFMETNKKFINFNVLRDEVLKVEDHWIDVGFASLIIIDFHHVNIIEKGTGRKLHNFTAKKPVMEVFRGSKPKEVYVNSKSWIQLDALRDLRLAHGCIVTYDQAIDVCRLKALTSILKPDELRITEEDRRLNEVKPKLQGFPLISLIGAQIPLCKIISKLNRKAYFRLRQTSKPMVDFIDANKKSINPNPLRGQDFVISERGFDVGFAVFKREDKYFKIVEKGTSKGVNCGVQLEVICEIIDGSKPRNVIYKSTNCSDLELLRSLNLSPGTNLYCGQIKEPHLLELMTILQPKELGIFQSVLNMEGVAINVFQLFKKPEYKCLKSIDLRGFITFMNKESFFQALLGLIQGRNPWRDLGHQDPMELEGLLERITSFELEGEFNEFPVDDLKKCIQNWCNGSNQMEYFNVRTTKPKIHTPVMWMLLGDVNETATYCRVSDLPLFMRKAFEKDTAGTIQNYNRQVDLRVIKNQTRVAYVYVTLVGTLGFRSFENRIYNPKQYVSV